MGQTTDSIQQQHKHKHYHRHHHKHRRHHYSTERQSQNRRELMFILSCTIFMVVAMLILIPLLTNFVESL